MLSTNFAFFTEKHSEWYKCSAQAEECLWDDPQTTGFKIRYVVEMILKSVYANVGLSVANIDGIEGLIANLDKMGVLPVQVNAAFHVVRDTGNTAAHPDKKKGPCTTSMARRGLESLYIASVWYYETYVDSDFLAPEFQPYVYACSPTSSSSERPTQTKQHDNSALADVPPSRHQEDYPTADVLPKHEQEQPATDAKPMGLPVSHFDLKEESTPDTEEAGEKPNRQDYGFGVNESEFNDYVLEIHGILADAHHMASEEQRSTVEVEVVSAEFEKAVAIASEPYRLAVLGAINAGKSTLINSLAGSQIAVTDFLCATCIPTGYIYSFRPTAKIEFNNGQTSEMSVDEFSALMQEKRDDTEWVNSVLCAKVGYPSDFLKAIEPWDVPGIGGNETDERKAIEFMDRVGGAIWVFDATLLGDAAISGPIHELQNKGVRMIAAMNKIDGLDESEIAAAVGSVHKEFDEAFIAVCPVSAENPDLNDGAYISTLVWKIQTGLLASSETERRKRADLAVATKTHQIERVLEKERSLHWSFIGFARHTFTNLGEERNYLLSKVPALVSTATTSALVPIENKALGLLMDGPDFIPAAYQALQGQKELKEAWAGAYRAVAEEALTEWRHLWFKAISLSIDSVPAAGFTIPAFEPTRESNAAEQEAIMAGVAAGGKAAAVAGVIAAALYIIHWPVIFVGLPIGILEWWKKRSAQRNLFDLRAEETRIKEAVHELYQHFAKSLEKEIRQLIEVHTEESMTATISEFVNDNYGGLAVNLIKKNEERYQNHVDALKAAREKIQRRYGIEEPKDGTTRPLIVSPEVGGDAKWIQFLSAEHEAVDIMLQEYWDQASEIITHLTPHTRVRMLTTCPESNLRSAAGRLREQFRKWDGPWEIRIVATNENDSMQGKGNWIITKSEALICHESLESMRRATCVFKTHPDGIFAAQYIFAGLWQGKGKHGHPLNVLTVR